ncbi:MAG TPA: carboxypeptidase regulatory-like domain-containing protein [Terracidiphilus sp.]|nr:carboxypeptidase regulatory-like domain-containing protein [Terracidiphilus sp.]
MPIKRLLPISLFLALAVSLPVNRIAAQGIVTGSITGTVQDPTGAVVPGATVTATQIGTNSAAKTTTNSAGTFQLPGLPIGAYNVNVEAAGFNAVTMEKVPVQTGTATPLPVTLKVGAASEAVTVEAASAILQPDSVQISEEFDTQKTADLPIGNGFDIVALLTPGVAPSGGNQFTNNNGAEFSTNGIRDRNNNFQLDGQANNDTNIGGPNVFFGNADAIAAVQVITSESAEYGRNSGAVVNYITQSGTNKFHGSAFEFYNGSWADSLANQDKSPLFGYCPAGVSPSTGCIEPTIPRYVDNRWGGTGGGPILRDRLWFFGSGMWEHTRTGTAPSFSNPLITPTPNGIQQLESAFPNNPAVGALAAIGPASVKAGQLSFGAPTTVDVLGVPIEFATARRLVSSPFNDVEAMGRADYQLSSRDRIFGRYIYQKSFTYNNNFFAPSEAVTGTFVNVGGTSHYVGADWAHTFSQSLLNQLRYSYSRSDVTFGGGGFPNCTTGAILTGCPIRISFSSKDRTDLAIGEKNDYWPQGRLIQSSQLQDNATWQIGNHSIKFGGEYSHFPETDYGIPYLNGFLVFSSFDAFIQSSPQQTLYADGLSTYDLTYNSGAVYFQDDFKAKPNLTLSLGLRYEVQSQPINGLHDYTTARESNPSTAFWDTSLPLNLRTVQSLPIVWHNLGPVAGFAWQPEIHGHSSTVLRGGFHIGYDATFNNPFSNIAQSTPMVNFANLQTCNSCIPADGSAASLRTIINPQVPLGVNPGSRAQSNTDPNLSNPYTEQWTLGIQQAFTNHVVGELRYLGNHGVGLLENRNGNPALGPLISAGFQNVIPSGLTPCTTAGAPGAKNGYGYADCNRTHVITLGNTGFSNYNGLQSRLSIEHWHGVTAGVSYTWSRNIDNVSEIYATVTGGNTTNFSQSPFDLSRSERGVSGLDYPQLASIYMIYEVPRLIKSDSVAATLVNGWQINPVWRYASGQPYTVLENAASDTLLCDPTQTSGSTTCRPILNNSRAPIDTVGQCTDPSAPDCGLVNYYTGAPVSRQNIHWIRNDDISAVYFGTPFAGGGRNQQRGQTINNANLALLKDFKVKERVTFELRGTAYNVLNRQYRGVPGVNIDYGNFADAGGSFGNTLFNNSGAGQTNSVFSGIDRRRIELGGKIRF